jgi:hypothetical protein
MVGDAREHVGKIRFRIEVIEFGRLCRLPDYADKNIDTALPYVV